MEEKNKKRILVLNYEFPPLGGGGGVAANKLAVGFIKLGYEVDYVTTWFKGLKKFEVVDGINVYRIKVIGRKELPTATMLSLISFPFLAYKKASKLCKSNKYDFINTHFAIPTGPLGVWLSKKYKIKNILSILGGDIYDPTKNKSPHRKWYLRMTVNWVLNNSDFIVAESSDIKNNAHKYYKCKQNIEIIPLPYEPFNFTEKTRKELGLEDDAFYTVSVGRLVARKGFDFLIRSMVEIKNEKIKALIIGDGPEKDNLRKLVESLDIVQRVIFLGSVSDEQKFQYLATSDLYVLSSIHEGFGIVLQEAMQVGLPIISTNNGGQVDFIKEGKNGYLVEVGNYEEISKKILELVNDDSLRKIMSDNNLINIKLFNVLNIAERYIKLLKTV